MKKIKTVIEKREYPHEGIIRCAVDYLFNNGEWISKNNVCSCGDEYGMSHNDEHDTPLGPCFNVETSRGTVMVFETMCGCCGSSFYHWSYISDFPPILMKDEEEEEYLEMFPIDTNVGVEH